MNLLDEHRYRKERDKMLKMLSLANLKQAVEDDLDDDERDKLVKNFKEADSMLLKGEHDKALVWKDRLHPFIETGKVVLPIAAYIFGSRFWANFEETGSARTAASRALESHKIKFF